MWVDLFMPVFCFSVRPSVSSVHPSAPSVRQFRPSVRCSVQPCIHRIDMLDELGLYSVSVLFVRWSLDLIVEYDACSAVTVIFFA